MRTVTELKLLQKQKLLEVTFDGDNVRTLPCEYLRVFSPSAEVKGHGRVESTLISGKAEVNIQGIDPVGNYAVKLIFDDGHDSGLYSWDYLWELAEHHARNWQQYLTRLHAAGASRT